MTPPADTRTPYLHLRSPRFIIMFSVLCALFSLGQFHRTSGAVMAPVFAEQLMLSADRVGLVIGGMFVVMGLMQLPSGILIDRFGTRIVVPTMAISAVVGSILISVADDWPSVLIGRAMLGAGFATSLLGAYTVFVRWGNSEIIATLAGRFLFLGGIGGLLAPYPLAFVIEHFGWRSVYVALGGATLLFAISCYIVVRDAPPDDDASDPANPASKKTLLGSILGLKVVLFDRRIWPALSCALFLYSPLQVLVGLWAGPFLKDIHHLESIQRSYILLGMSFCMSFGMLMFGPIERFFNKRRAVILCATAFIATMFGVLAIWGYSSLVVSATLFLVITLAGPFFLVLLAHTQVLFPTEYTSRVVSLINLLAISGIFVMQYVTGLIISAVTDDPTVTGSLLGYRLVFGLMCAIFFFMTAAYSRTRDIPPRLP